MTHAFVGLGSNIDPEANIRSALRLLAATCRVKDVSTIYRTKAEGPHPQPDYLNGVVELETSLAPAAFEARLDEIEHSLGRVRATEKAAPRTIDLDLLVYTDGDGRRPLWPGLEDVRTRAFVAVPLGELAPGLVLPDGTRLQEVIAHLPPWPMEPLPELSGVLKKSLHDGHRQGPSPRS